MEQQSGCHEAACAWLDTSHVRGREAEVFAWLLCKYWFLRSAMLQAAGLPFADHLMKGAQVDFNLLSVVAGLT